MDDAQKRLEARKARLDEARKKRVNNFNKRPGEADAANHSSPSLGSSSSSSAALGSPSRPPQKPSAPSSFSPSSAPKPSAGGFTSVRPIPPSSFPATAPFGRTPTPSNGAGNSLASSVSSTAVPGGFMRPTTTAPSSPSLGSSSSFSSSPSPSPVPAPALSSTGAPRNGFAKPLPPSARPRPGRVAATQSPQGSPFGSPASSPPVARKPEAGAPAASSPSNLRRPLFTTKLLPTTPGGSPSSFSPSSSSSPSPTPSPSPSSPARTGFASGPALPLSVGGPVNRPPLGSPRTSPFGARPAGLQVNQSDELRKKKEAEEAELRKAEDAKRKVVEEEERKTKQDEEDRKRKEEEVEENRVREEQAKQQQASASQASDEKNLEKRLHYINVFVDLQKKEREQTKARRQEAREARELRIRQSKEGDEEEEEEEEEEAEEEELANVSHQPQPQDDPPLPEPESRSPCLPVEPSTPEEPTQQLAAPVGAESPPFVEESEVDREIRMIIEIGKMKEEVDRYKRMCKDEEARVAGLKKQVQLKAEAEARRKRGWVASGGGSVIVKSEPKNASVYQNKDITKRPLVGGARFFSVYTPAGGGSPIDGYEPTEERTRSPSFPRAVPNPTPVPSAPSAPAPAPASPRSRKNEKSSEGGGDSGSGRGKLMRSKSGKILRSFLSTYIPSAASSSSSSSLASASSALAGPGDRSTSADSDDVAAVAKERKAGLARKRDLRKSFSLEMGLVKKKGSGNGGTSSDSDGEEKKKEKERAKQEKKEKKEKEKKEKEKEKEKKKKGGKAATVFNSTLEEVMSLQNESDGDVPIILKTLTDAIFSLNGHRSEGIFRLSPSLSDVSKLKDQFNAKNYELTTTDPHVVASCLKSWFRELSQPLIPHDFYDECIKKAHHVEQIKQLVATLPPINQKVIEFFACFLLKVADEQNVVVTKMGLDNLAIVFSPGFLRCLDPMKMMANSALEGLFVENLIEIYKAA